MALPARTERLVRTLGAAVCAALSVATAARPAHAEPPRASLVVTRGPGAEDCPDAAGVQERIRPLTRANVFETSPEAPPDTWIQIELLRGLSGYSAVIAARGRRQGTRNIEDVGTSCASLADAVAITLVMLLDPEPVHPATAPPVKPPEPAPPPAPAPRRERFLFPGAELDGGASIGVLSHAAPLLEGGGRLGLGALFTLAAGGGFVFPDRAQAENGSVKLDLTYAYLRGSLLVFDNGSTRLALVAGALLGSLLGEGSGRFETPRTRHLLWGAGAGGAEVFAPLTPPFAWSARLLTLIEPVREGFTVMEGDRPVRAFRTSTVGGVLSVGVSAAL